MTPAWCVQHREGWCATKGGRLPDPDAWHDESRCGYVVIGRWGDEKRLPTCEECLAHMRRSRGKRTESSKHDCL